MIEICSINLFYYYYYYYYYYRHLIDTFIRHLIDTFIRHLIDTLTITFCILLANYLFYYHIS